MKEDRFVWMNGKITTGCKANVPLLSHSFSRGSAIFEAFGVHESRNGPAVFRMDQHLKRLEKSADERYLAKGELLGTSLPIWRGCSHLLKGVGFNYDFADEEGPLLELKQGNLLIN